jgi:DNA-binding transcriptional LysR family regulator
MTAAVPWQTIELHLVRVLLTVIAERSVSRAAWRLGHAQPVVSAQLKRLRALTGDPLLVRAGRDMVPTAAALQMVEPARRLLAEADALFGARPHLNGFEPSRSELAVTIAASDYLDPLFLPEVVTRLHALAPGMRIELVPLSGRFDVQASLASGEADLVIGNWLHPPAELHLGRLASDEIVCLVAEDHPAVRSPRQWTAERYLASDHVAPSALYLGGRGVIDEQLRAHGLERPIAVRVAHFSLIPRMVAGSRLVLTTGRQFCQRYVDELPLRIVRCPVALPPMAYYQLWHDRTHRSAAHAWVRLQVREAAAALAAGRRPLRSAPAHKDPG